MRMHLFANLPPRDLRLMPTNWVNECNGSGSSSYLLHSEIEPPSQKESQRSTVHVPDFCGNVVDTCLAGLQEMHRAFNTQTLEIRHR